jgi:hypothetical protein
VTTAVLPALAADQYELAVGRAAWLRMESRKEPEQVFQMINSH